MNDIASFIIGIIQFGFALAVVPTILDEDAKVSRWSSGLTAGGLFIIAALYLMLGLKVAALCCTLCAIAWSLVFWLRPIGIRTKVGVDGPVTLYIGIRDVATGKIVCEATVDEAAFAKRELHIEAGSAWPEVKVS